MPVTSLSAAALAAFDACCCAAATVARALAAAGRSSAATMVGWLADNSIAPAHTQLPSATLPLWCLNAHHAAWQAHEHDHMSRQSCFTSCANDQSTFPRLGGLLLGFVLRTPLRLRLLRRGIRHVGGLGCSHALQGLRYLPDCKILGSAQGTPRQLALLRSEATATPAFPRFWCELRYLMLLSTFC